MADILNIGTSALLSLQRAVNTTGHNISNANTEGFSRQTVNFETLAPQLRGGAYVGSGVGVDSIERSYNQFLVSDVRDRTSSHAGFQAFHDLSARLDGLLADANAGLGPVLDRFFSAVQDVSNNPGSLPERQVLLGEAQSLADRFNSLDGNFRRVNSELNSRIETNVSEINSFAENIASLNQQIVRATALAGGAPPNDLLDRRDLLINQLSEKVNVTTVEQSDGAINIVVGNGQSLVVGFDAQQLQTFDNPLDNTQLQVSISGVAGAVDLSRFFSGGELGAALSFRQQVLDPARNQLGLIATGLTETFNSLHQNGVDLNGNPGGEFFTPLNATVAAHTGNAGSGAVSATINDVSALTGDDYRLVFEAGNFVLTNTRTGASQTGAGPFTVDGLTINTSGTPANGDSFLVQPVRQSATLFNVALSRPEDFAAGSPLRSSEALANTGSAQLDQLTVSNPAALPLATSVTLTFNPDALGAGVPGFDVTGIAGGPLAYDPVTESNGKTFTLGGFDFSVSGAPQSGDQLVIENNTGGTGDNRNALALADLQTATGLLGGNASFQDAYGSLVADVGVKTRQSEISADAEEVLLTQAQAARDSVSGVNLEEEAANLLRFQRAYQAAAQVISVADELFQTLLNATRR